MSDAEILRLVEAMRAAQRAYFNPATRTVETLDRSRALERQLDRALRERKAGPRLFPEEDGRG